MMQPLSERLFLFEDTCRVYLLRIRSEGILIDFGSGGILEALEETGVTHVTDVLMTHHHRDNTQGLAKAAAAGIRIWVPHTEQDLFRSVEAHWQARDVLNSYNNRQDRFSLLESVPVHATLKDYTTLRFGDLELTVLPTPGHTTGSVSLLTTVAGQQLAFTGDLIAAPGKLWSLAATQWSYNGGEGIPATVASLLELKEHAPDLLLPSHGETMTAPAAAIDPLVERLSELMRERKQNPRFFQLREQPFEAITPHLLRNRTAMAYSYVLLSESGKALLIDFGYDFMTGTAAGTDRASRRPWLYSLPTLARDYGIKAIDVVLPTHYHDDHVAGINLLREVYGTNVWVPEVFADVLEHPYRYDLPCLWYDPIPVDRRLPQETPIVWEEYELTLHHQSGHTYYGVVVSVAVDGTRALFIGDQYAGGGEAEANYVYKNKFHLDDYRHSAVLYRQLKPDLILSGHWEPYWVEPGYFDKLEQRGEMLARLHRELLPDERFEVSAVAGGTCIYPYTAEVKGGESVRLEVQAHNPFQEAKALRVTLVVPVGWGLEPACQEALVEAKGNTTCSFTLTPSLMPVRRARVAADISADAGLENTMRLGQQAEALITVF